MDRPALEQRSAIPQKIQENLPENRNVGGEDSDEDEDYPITADQIKPRLCECLDNATSTSADSFACDERLKNAPSPALSIRDHGSIRFPLSDQDIEKIITASVLSRTQVKIKKDKQAATRSRGIWEIPGSMIELRNPAWEALIESILASIAIQLGVNIKSKGISENMSALILYKAGSSIATRQR
jgi:hypothetical protein